jgi:quercetin dioxygenase-like cupin family protein
MKNFSLIAEGVDVVPIRSAIAMRPHLWNQNTLRTKHPQTAHAEVDDIWLRFNEIDPQNPLAVVDATEAINYPAWWELPQARQPIFDLMRRVEGERLGRCMITRLSPGKRITPHVDMGAPATYYDRFHIVLQGAAGSLFRAGDETVCMRTGEVWWFDNQVEHEVVNNSAGDRVHIVVDIRVSR